jgi:hypothetical protein
MHTQFCLSHSWPALLSFPPADGSFAFHYNHNS